VDVGDGGARRQDGFGDALARACSSHAAARTRRAATSLRSQTATVDRAVLRPPAELPEARTTRSSQRSANHQGNRYHWLVRCCRLAADLSGFRL
jgi:hypothetical protein